MVCVSGTVRDHARRAYRCHPLAYEAYEEQVVPRFRTSPRRDPATLADVGRVALWHRVGTLAVGESSVIVVVSSPHRHMAFEAARFGIDALKATAPIWKKEAWAGGEQADWALTAQDIGELAPAAQPSAPEPPPAAGPGHRPEN